MAQPQDHKARDCKILSIVWYKVLPARFGGQKAIAKLNEHLASFAPVFCICSNNNQDVSTAYQVENSLPVNKAQFINPLVWWKIYCYAKANGVTHLILEFPYHGIAAALCQKLLGLHCVLNTHNIEYLRFKGLGKWWWRLLFHYERWVMRRCDFVFFKTESDRADAIKVFGLDKGETAIVPYGVDGRRPFHRHAENIIRKRHSIDPQEKILLFAGTLDYQPNAEAVLDIQRKLVPILIKLGFGFKVLICGRNHLPEFSSLKEIDHPAMIFAGEVDDIEPYFAAADVFINPVIIGGGVQTKIIDALSYNRNVVAFESKAKGILDAGDKLYTAPDNDWNAFARAICEAAGNNDEIPAAFFDRYNWRTIAAEAYQKICSL